MTRRLSINDLVEKNFGWLREKEDENVEFLYDGSLPRIYTTAEAHDGPVELESRLPFSLNYAFFVLMEELQVHGRGNKRIITLFDGDKQVVNLDHQGPQIPLDKLAFINETIQLVLGGERLSLAPKSRFAPHGTRMIARCLRRFGGDYAIINIDDDGYSVRSIVQVPLG